MEAELIRSLLESNDIPAAVFGEGTYAFGSDNISTTERVMVRTDHFEAARAAIKDAGVSDEGGFEEIDDGAVTDDGSSFEDEEEEEWDGTGEGDDLEVLAQGSDWGPRLVGMVGIAALIVAAIVILRAAT